MTKRAVTIEVMPTLSPESLSTHQIDVSEVIDGVTVTTPGGVLRGQDPDVVVVRTVARHMTRTAPLVRAAEARVAYVEVVERQRGE